jgi:hypothetical protein
MPRARCRVASVGRKGKERNVQGKTVMDFNSCSKCTSQCLKKYLIMSNVHTWKLLVPMTLTKWNHTIPTHASLEKVVTCCR